MTSSLKQTDKRHGTQKNKKTRFLKRIGRKCRFI